MKKVATLTQTGTFSIIIKFTIKKDVRSNSVKYMTVSSEVRAWVTMNYSQAWPCFVHSPLSSTKGLVPLHRPQPTPTSMPGPSLRSRGDGEFCQQYSKCQWAHRSMLTQTSLSSETIITFPSQNRTYKCIIYVSSFYTWSHALHSY